MIGPADLADWTYDERDELSAYLRRQDSIHAVVTGADATARAFPGPVRRLVRLFAAQHMLSMDDLHAIAAELPETEAPIRRFG